MRANVLAPTPRPLIVGRVRSGFATAIRASDGSALPHKAQPLEGGLGATDAVVFELPGQLEVADAIILRP